jgi:hypothetical protein
VVGFAGAARVVARASGWGPLVKRGWRTKLALASASLLATAVLAELGARIALGGRFVFGAHRGAPQGICGEFDSELGWRNRPETHVRIAARGFEYEVSLNERGERGPLRPYEKPAGVQRVIVLGDSTSWGWGVDDERMWTRLVERELGAGVELINLAVPGYGTDQELWVLEREGQRYEPDLVLLGLVHNDLVSNRFPVMQGMSKPVYQRTPDGAWELVGRPVALPEGVGELSGRRTRRVLARYSALFKAFEPPPPEPARYDLADPKVLAGIERFWTDLSDPQGWTYMLLGRLNETARASGAEFVAFVIPHLVDRHLSDPRESPPEPIDDPRSYVSPGSRRLADTARALEFDAFSIDAVLLEEVRRGVNLDCGDEHLNERGNQIVAEVVARELRARLKLQ